MVFTVRRGHMEKREVNGQRAEFCCSEVVRLMESTGDSVQVWVEGVVVQCEDGIYLVDFKGVRAVGFCDAAQIPMRKSTTSVRLLKEFDSTIGGSSGGKIQ